MRQRLSAEALTELALQELAMVAETANFGSGCKTVYGDAGQ